jgi:hypothetical protein
LYGILILLYRMFEDFIIYIHIYIYVATKSPSDRMSAATRDIYIYICI